MIKRIKAYAILWHDVDETKLWHDVDETKIDCADRFVFNECPSIEPTKAMALYEEKKDVPDFVKGEYVLVPWTISYKTKK